MKLKQFSVENYTFMLTFLCSIHKAQHCNTATAHNNLGKKWRNWGQSPYKSESAYPSPMITLKYCREIKRVVKNTSESILSLIFTGLLATGADFSDLTVRDYLLNARDKNSQDLTQGTRILRISYYRSIRFCSISSLTAFHCWSVLLKE